MTAVVPHFALIGRSFPIAAFQDLHNASLLHRASRREAMAEPATRRWRPAYEPILVPARLRG